MLVNRSLVLTLVMCSTLAWVDMAFGEGKPSSGLNGQLTRKEYKRQLLQLQKRKKVYLREKATISRDLYNQMFSGKCDQENTNNCWVLAALGAIPLEHREALFRTSIEKVGDTFEIQFPLGSSRAKVIRVTARDLEPQIVMEDGEEKIYRPVKSSYGWQILEAAYTLHQFGRDSKGQVNRRASNGGHSHKALRELVPTQPESQEIISHSTEPLLADHARQQATLRRFASYRPGVSMYIASSLKKDPPLKLVPKHAYVIQMINDSSGHVMLINPYDSERPLVLTYNQFLSGFRRLFCLEINLAETFQ